MGVLMPALLVLAWFLTWLAMPAAAQGTVACRVRDGQSLGFALAADSFWTLR
jgi:hypothetical protein